MECMTTPTLLRQGSPLANPAHQLQILEPQDATAVPPFARTLTDHRLPPLRADGVRVLQINVGKLCNQTCTHCHVDAGPERREIMTRETFEACLRVIDSTGIDTVDLTGGAPEMNPHFGWFVTEVRRLGRHVIDRCNLTILTAPGFMHLPEFLAAQQVEIVASLPCYLETNCDLQRGDGVFAKSIKALQRLNQLGYGQGGLGLTLSLVYNPVGPALPPSQAKLEAAYRDQLRTRFGIEFNRLYTITNMPISRFLDELLHSGRYEEYMQKLLAAFNPLAVEAVMCRTTLSVDWQGNLYDCDFNQMLALPVVPSVPRTIHEFDLAALATRPIITGRHCYGCTAGAGSSCQGELMRGE
jgi:radical SAM/Cys-rich protein